MRSVAKTVPSNSIDLLKTFRFPGFNAVSYKTVTDDSRFIELHIQLEHEPYSLYCPRCGMPCHRVKDEKKRIVRDAPIMGCDRVFLHFSVRRVRCGHCGCSRQEKIDWMEPNARITNTLVLLLQQLLRLKLPISEIAHFLGLSWDTVKDYDKLMLTHLFREIDVSSAKHLLIDEFAIFKGHRYMTAVMDADSGKVIWTGVGKSASSMIPFFEFLKARGVADQIETVSCDMNAAYPRLVKENLPKAKVLYDLFHVIKNFVEVLKAARIKVQKQLKAEAEAKFIGIKVAPKDKRGVDGR